ncbi:MAG: DUF4340 domain-containing protein [Desulfobacteraceae bacterium]|nr:DUF4340 domain-containing protein [Desulfobacteraceae bacterium]
MKKEYLILVVLILALSAYLVFKKDNQQNYTLPEPVKIAKGEIDKIVITRNNQPIELKKENDTWVLTDKKFTANMTAVNNMLNVIRNLKISALISDGQDALRYELDKTHAIEVKAFESKNLLSSFKIGKTAPSGNHTFIMLAGNPRIYQANNNFKEKFSTSVDTLRNKQVLTFKEDSIKQITLEKDGVSKTLNIIPAKDDKEKIPVSWKFKDGTSPDKEALTNLLSSLSFLTCERFSDSLSMKDLEKKAPLCKIILENGTPIVLNLFSQENEDSVIGTSSMSPYPFVMDSYKGKDILSYVDKLTAIVKEKKKIDKE